MSKDEQTEEFIDVVRRYPYLYDLEDPHYKDNVKKMNTWREIATQFRFKDGNEAKMKWRNLKDSYNKFKKSIATTTGQAYKKYKKWPWSEYMQFLDVLNTHRQPDESLSSERSEVIGDSEIESVDMSRPGTSFSGSSSSSKRKKPTDEMGMMIEYFEKRRQQTAVDHINQLFLSYANTFKHMSSRTQISLKLKMAQLFAEAETEDLIFRDILATDINSRTAPAETIISGIPQTGEVNVETPLAAEEEVNAEILQTEEVNAELLQTEEVNAELLQTEEVNAELLQTEEVNAETSVYLSDGDIGQYLKFN